MVQRNAMSLCAVLAAAVLAGAPASAEPLSAEQARAFVVGKIFSFTCFDGTHGIGRINGDGSVAGRVRMQGSQPERSVAMPPDTLRVRGDAVCASLRGAAFEPCFDLLKTGARSFRGHLAGIPGMWCHFQRPGTRPGQADRTATGSTTRPVSASSN